MFFLLGNSQKSTSALSCQLMQGSAKLFLYFAHARSHSKFVFFCLNAWQKFHHHSLELVSMVQLSQCQQKWFILFHVFCLFHIFLSSVGSARLAGLLSASKTKIRAHSLKRAQVCDGVDTVIVFARIFGAHFFVSFLTFQFLYFCLLFFGETFGHRASAFLSFLIINMGGPEKKAQFFFWAQLFLLNRSSGGLDYVMSDDLTSFFFFLIIFWECSHSTTFLGVGEAIFFLQ